MCSDIHQLNQLSASQAHANLVATNANAGFDGTFMPRVRARRGMATDPHSIAERVSYCHTSYTGTHTKSGENVPLIA